MKTRLYGKKAGIALLISLIVISLAEVIYRAIALTSIAFTTSNFGEPLAFAAFATVILVLTFMGKDNVCYICYGAWAGYFLLDQLYALPRVVSDVFRIPENGFTFVIFSPILHAVSMICILAIGVLLIKYMSDGMIFNLAFNILCIVAAVSVFGCIVVNIVGVASGLPAEIVLVTFHNLYRLTMIFLLAFFAYDGAKAQLKNPNFIK